MQPFMLTEGDCGRGVCSAAREWRIAALDGAGVHLLAVSLADLEARVTAPEEMSRSNGILWQLSSG